jgi:hypothetical protein
MSIHSHCCCNHEIEWIENRKFDHHRDGNKFGPHMKRDCQGDEKGGQADRSLAVAPAYLVRDIPDNEEPFRDRKLEENKTSELNWRFRKVHDDKVDDQARVLCDEIIT